MANNNRWIGIAIGSIVLVLTAFTALLGNIGFFDFTGTDASAKIVASALALVGALIGSLVTIVGLFLKHSFDERTAALKDQAEDRLKMDSDRNNSLQEEAEKRLKLEAAMQAVKLLSSSSGGDVPVTQRAGVIFSLASLGLPELALTMAYQMMSTDRIDPGTVSWLINHIFESDDDDLKRNAAILLSDYPEKFLLDKGQSAFPACLELTWSTQLPELVRSNAALALLRMIAARPFSEWNKEVFAGHVVTLNAIWETETNKRIKNGVGLCLKKIIDVYPSGHELYPPSGTVFIDALRKELAKPSEKPLVATTQQYYELVNRFEEWVQQVGSRKL